MLSLLDARQAVSQAWARYASILRSLSESDWERRTRLPGWSVRDLVAHTVAGTSMEADALRRWRSGETEAAVWPQPDPAAGPHELLAAQLESCAELSHQLTHVESGDRDRLVPMPYGALPVDLVLQIFTMEAAVHAHDLAVACGKRGALDDDAVRATVVVLEVFRPVFAAAADETPTQPTTVALRSCDVDLRLRFDEGTWSSAPDATPTDVITGDDSTLVLFALGRVPADAVGGSAAARQKFKAWFPGP